MKTIKVTHVVICRWVAYFYSKRGVSIFAWVAWIIS